MSSLYYEEYNAARWDSEDESDPPFDEAKWWRRLRKIRENFSHLNILDEEGEGVHNVMTDENWEEFGRDISNNTHLAEVFLCSGALTDRTMTIFFKGLTRSSSINNMNLMDNDLTAVGVQSMVPFLQNANSLQRLCLNENNIQSKGFNVLLRALRNSPIKELNCSNCGIESVDIVREHIPKQLKTLHLSENNINTDGCRGVTTLLQGGKSTLTCLDLRKNKIDDEGVEILVDALQHWR